MPDKQEAMLRFWSERAEAFGSDPRANTNDVHLRTLEIDYLDRMLHSEAPARVLDFGCANGFTTLQLASQHRDRSFVGLDLNPTMIGEAQQALGSRGFDHVEFRCHDLSTAPLEPGYDLIYCVRVLQNMPSLEHQCRAVDALGEALAEGGTLVLIESYEDGYGQLNRDRGALGLPPLPIHPHLTLLTHALDSHAASRLQPVQRDSLSSSYYLVTRLLYSALAAETGEPIDYDHPLHRLAARIPQVGSYGPQWASVYRKTGGTP